MLKQKLKLKRVHLSRAGWLAVLVFIISGMSGGLTAHADQLNQQIQNLENKNAQKEQSLSNLQIKASNYQDAINKLQDRVDDLEGQILNTQAQQTTVRKKIADTQAQLNHQKSVLGDAIRTMYLDGQASTLEVLLSSDNLSDFVDQEQYHLTVENNIKALLDKITTLKQQEQAQNDRLSALLQDQQTEQNSLVTSRNQKGQLLSLNQGQQAKFNQQIAANNSQIAMLQAQQAAENTANLGVVGSGPNCGGGYPAQWCEMAMDSTSDNWGMFNRECVSYAAFKVYASGEYMPAWGLMYAANAKDWLTDASYASSRAAGITVSSTPKGYGDVAIWVGASFYGHAMFVEGVASDGGVIVSDYNYNDTGQYGAPREYSQAKYQSLGFRFIHFPPR